MSVQVFIALPGVAEEAANHYVATIPGATLEQVVRAPGSDEVFSAELTVGGCHITCANIDLGTPLTSAMSLVVSCKNQAEIDQAWVGLAAHGEGMCGWTTDKFGVSWQVVPTELPTWLAGPNAHAVQAVMQTMTKLDYAALRNAALS